MKNVLLLTATLFLLEANAQSWSEVDKIVASDRGSLDYYGTAVAISGSYAIVGAYNEDEDATGANSLSNAGAAYIYERDASGNWLQVQKIVASDRAAEDFFGFDVDMDGSYAIVGAYQEDEDASGLNTWTSCGSAYIFERDAGGTWNEVQKITHNDRASNDYFGYTVGISGSYAIVGALYEDQDTFGINTILNAGSAYIFERDAGGTWNQAQKLITSVRASQDKFGNDVAISGTYAIIGATYEDEDAAGANYMSSAGSAFIFERDGSGKWNETQKLVASDRAASDYFGYRTAISGNYAIIGSYQEDHDVAGGGIMSASGSAYIFERDAGGTWSEVQKICASDRAASDWFGAAVAIDGDLAVVGAYTEDEDTSGLNTLSNAGSAYIYERDAGGTWIEAQKIVASDRAVDDWFGFDVSVSGTYVIVGANKEDEDVAGANTLLNPGSAYIFELLNCSDIDSPYIVGSAVVDTSIYMNDSLLRILISEPILCSTINGTGSDFELDCSATTTPAACAANSITSATAISCVNDTTRYIELSLDNPTPSWYANDWRVAVASSSGITDTCGNYLSTNFSAVILPIELIDFSGQLTPEGQVALHWETAMEQQFSGFEIQRSFNGYTFESIGYARPKGDNSRYTLLDLDPTVGKNYYRLKMNSTDGNYTYSSVIVFHVLKGNFQVQSVAPIPASNVLNIQFYVNQNEKVRFELHSLVGVKVLSTSFLASTGYHEKALPISHLEPGVYFLSVSNDDGVQYMRKVFIR